MTPGPDAGRVLRYVALGDSYTIGTGVAAAERWPDQLVARFAAGARVARGSGVDGSGPSLELVGNPAVNGFTTGDLIAVELPLLTRLRPQVVSMLIGTNDLLQGIGEAEYRRNLGTILDAVRPWASGRTFGVTSPDYTVTPAGADYGDPAIRSAELRRRNAIFTEVLAARAIPVTDILDLSLRAAAERSLVAADGLHPSGRQYGLWVDRIEPLVRQMLGDR